MSNGPTSPARQLSRSELQQRRSTAIRRTGLTVGGESIVRGSSGRLMTEREARAESSSIANDTFRAPSSGGGVSRDSRGFTGRVAVDSRGEVVDGGAANDFTPEQARVAADTGFARPRNTAFITTQQSFIPVSDSLAQRLVELERAGEFDRVRNRQVSSFVRQQGVGGVSRIDGRQEFVYPSGEVIRGVSGVTLVDGTPAGVDARGDFVGISVAPRDDGIIRGFVDRAPLRQRDSFAGGLTAGLVQPASSLVELRSRPLVDSRGARTSDSAFRQAGLLAGLGAGFVGGGVAGRVAGVGAREGSRFVARRFGTGAGVGFDRAVTAGGVGLVGFEGYRLSRLDAPARADAVGQLAISGAGFTRGFAVSRSAPSFSAQAAARADARSFAAVDASRGSFSPRLVSRSPVISRRAVLESGVAPESPAAVLISPRQRVEFQTQFGAGVDGASLLRREATRRTFAGVGELPVWASAGLAPQQASLTRASLPARQLNIARTTSTDWFRTSVDDAFLRAGRDPRQARLFSRARDVDLLVPFDSPVSGFRSERFTVPEQFSFRSTPAPSPSVRGSPLDVLLLTGRRGSLDVARRPSPLVDVDSLVPSIPSFGRLTPVTRASRPPSRTSPSARVSPRFVFGFSFGSRSLSRASSLGRATPIPRLDSVSLVDSRPRLDLDSFTRSTPIPRLDSVSLVDSRPRSPVPPSFPGIPRLSPPVRPPSRPSPIPPPTAFPGLPSFGTSALRSRPGRGRRRREEFTPSLVANVLGLRGRPRRTSQLTGLEIRTISL